MIESLPLYIRVFFIITSLMAVGILIYTIRLGFHRVKNNLFIPLILVWMMIQLLLAVREFYLDFQAMPPRFLYAVIPPTIFIIYFTVGKYNQYVAPLSLKMLTIIHIVRIPVEWILWLLYQHQWIPKIMTFEGYNWDVLVGISAIGMALWSFDDNQPREKILLIWNIVGLGFLVNIVTIAILSTPLPFQQLAFEQPNKAVFYFPFIWLPSVIVPIVLFSHVASIIKLVKRDKEISISS